eukprot:TRINITY_DN16112_c0_g1_i2.p2 TRINITY_DN16112_c0_g1~~TRINITY_DN16112_c0_g1_i2.p2  ORF type:complete len:111 (-),score=21.40 TRINITY_DN16112_c0_g1_i2:46-378(-)
MSGVSPARIRATTWSTSACLTLCITRNESPSAHSPFQEPVSTWPWLANTIALSCLLETSRIAFWDAVPVLCVDTCLLYTSDAADDLLCVDLGGRRIIKKKNTRNDPRHIT